MYLSGGLSITQKDFSLKNFKETSGGSINVLIATHSTINSQVSEFILKDKIASN